MEAARRLIGIALLWAAPAGCSFRVIENNRTDAEVIPDASVCVDLSKSCATSTVLRDCQEVGKFPLDTPCPWGCLDAAQPADCGKLQPAGGVLTEADLVQGQGLMEVVASAGGVINTDDGSITGLRTAGIGVDGGIEYARRTVSVPGGGTRMVGVFRFGKLSLMGTWTVTGQNALAIASLGEVVIQGQLDLRGDCVAGAAGPGGTPGDLDNAAEPGGGNGGAANGNNDSSGGGGGGYGANGGNGGRIAATGTGPEPGVSWGDPMISVLVGGGGGGGGGGTNDGIGGGGGGAVQIAANGKISIRVAGGTSGINAGGCGGKGGADGGGGGGSGGTILLEAPAVELDGTGTYLVVNGGGGGGGGNTSAAGNGASGGWSSAPAAGGAKGGGQDGAGGPGGAAGSLPGQNGGDTGTSGGTDSGGGGGGGVGRIRVLTRLADGVSLVTGSVVSPTFDEASSTATKAVAKVQ